MLPPVTSRYQRLPGVTNGYDTFPLISIHLRLQAKVGGHQFVVYVRYNTCSYDKDRQATQFMIG